MRFPPTGSQSYPTRALPLLLSSPPYSQASALEDTWSEEGRESIDTLSPSRSGWARGRDNSWAGRASWRSGSVVLFQETFPAAPPGCPSLFLTDWEPSVLDQVTTLSCPRIIFPCPLQPTHRSSLLLPNFILALRPDPPPMPMLRPASKLSHPSCLDPFAHDVPSTGHNLLCPWTCLCPTPGCLLDSRQLEKPFWSSVSYRVSFHPPISACSLSRYP